MRIIFISFVVFLLSANSFGFNRYGPRQTNKRLAYSEELELVVSTSFDYTAVIWDAHTMLELKQLIGHDAAVNAAAFRPMADGSLLRATTIKSYYGRRRDSVILGIPRLEYL